ncbi:DUF7882 family protein [Microbacterium sp. USHLN186]|uniref:DUF7882 family protein n=1 Tax=Microbacterium sp. USHLN186 TaxID=3081286 RepID=UPI00301B1433
MGTLHYGATGDPIEMPDRILAHLKVLISTKLRRSESFSLSWDHIVDGAVERSSIWLHCSIPLQFQMDAEAASKLDRAYLQELADAANTSNGVIIDLCDQVAERDIADLDVRTPTLVRAA